MATEELKTIEEYTQIFEDDYKKIVNTNLETPQKSKNMQHSNFQIFTLYTDKTPVVASNSTTCIAKTL